MTIYFHNQGELDLDAIRTMGVNVKESDTAIGYFGTGMKFAIAVLLRTGHEVKLEISGKHYNFTAREKVIRDKSFQIVYMNDEQLGFTTELGKNWKVWMAYRELASNAMDEGGTALNHAIKDDTVWQVSGPDIEEAHHQRRAFFLDSRPIATVRNVEIHPNATPKLYYRGVFVYELDEGESFSHTYNLLGTQELTEDRTLKSTFGAHWDIRRALEDENMPLPILQKCFAFFGHENNYKYSCLTLNMRAAAEPHRYNMEFNADIKDMLLNEQEEQSGFPACALSSFEREQIQAALRLLTRLDCHLTEEDFVVTPTLGPRCYGIYNRKRNEIVIAHTVVDKGATFIASTLYEEWLHKTQGFTDCSLEMQQFLFDRVVALAARMPDNG